MLPRELNVADLPTVVFGKRSPMWWATAGIMLVEGVLLAIFVVLGLVAVIKFHPERHAAA